MKRHLLTSLALSLSLVACSNTPTTFGEKLEQRSETVDAMGKQWNQGQANVARGEKMIKEGQDMIEEGRQLVENGKKQMADSEAGYQNMRSNPIQPSVQP